MRRTAYIALLAGLTVAVSFGSAPRAGAQDTISGLRISDEAGASLGEQPSPPGEKHFRLDHGVDSFHIAFDVVAQAPTQVQVRVLGPMGTILMQESETYEGGGTQVVTFDNEGVPLEDNEYVVNAYVGEEYYLADSLQLAIGAAEIAPSSGGDDVAFPTTEVVTVNGTVVPSVATSSVAGPADSAIPGGPPGQVLLVAAIAVVGLLGIVLWAGWSAMKPR